MKLTVENIAGIDDATIEIEGITLLAGPNGSGKTTLAQACADVLTGSPLARGIQAKKYLDKLLRDGATAGTALLQGPEGEAKIAWPDGVYETRGKRPPQASAIAAGTQHFMRLSNKERAELLNRVLRVPLPNVARACEGIGLSVEQIESVAETVRTDGWDVALAEAKARGSMLKARWEAMTNERYGRTKALDWMPETLRDSLKIPDLQALMEECEVCRREHEALSEGMAISADRALRLQEVVADAEEVEKEGQELQQTKEEVEEQLRALLDKEHALPKVSLETGLACPWGCEGRKIGIHKKLNERGQPYEIALTKIEAPANMSQLEFEKARLAKRDINAQIDELEKQINAINEALARNAAELKGIKKATSNLEDLGAGADPKRLRLAEVAMQQAEARYNAAKLKRDADEINNEIQQQIELVALLSPDGLRLQALVDALDEFVRNTLDRLLSGLMIDPDMNVLLAGRLYGLLSAGERVSVDAALQIAIASLDTSDMVILDEIEELDGRRRAMVVQMIRKVEIPALMTMAARTPKGVPDLRERGVGRTYWLQDASAVVLSDALVAA